MKTKALPFAILIGCFARVVAGVPSDLVLAASEAAKARTMSTSLSPATKLVTVVDSTGRPVVVLSGQKVSGDFRSQKLTAAFASGKVTNLVSASKPAKSLDMMQASTLSAAKAAKSAKSLDMKSLDMKSLDMKSLDMKSLDMKSLDMMQASTLSAAKAANTSKSLALSGAKATKSAKAAKSLQMKSLQIMQAATTATGAMVAKPMMAPGQTIFLGSTGSAAATTQFDTTVVSARGSSAPNFSANPLAASAQRQVFRGDLPRDTTLATSGLTLGSPATAAAQVAIGPNGFPVPAAAAQQSTISIGPNGFPEMTTTQTGLNGAGTSRAATAPTTIAPASRSGSISLAPAAGASATTGAATASTTSAAASPQ